MQDKISLSTFTPPQPLKTAVLFLIFNRLDTTKQVFEAIRQAKPRRLYIAADGARDSKPGEDEMVKAVRDYVMGHIDWDCEVKTLFREKNMGCKYAPCSGIDWFFENEEMGIILEDDCLPHPDFFRFCEIMLEYYRCDNRIMMICGTNYLLHASIPDSYFFSNYYSIWGWATWRRAWKLYDVDMKAWDDLKKRNQLQWVFSHREVARYYESMFDLIYNGFDAWDIQWWFTCIFQHGLAIVPKTNLISNVGMIGTHSETQGDFFTNMDTYPIDVNNIRHPLYVTPDIVLNSLIYESSHAGLSLSVKTALKKRKFKSAIKALLPHSIIRFIKLIKKS